jgi:pyridoxine/pyridoxamine 5'-phosphate oxidase
LSIMIDERTTDAVLADIWARLVRARHDRRADWRWFTVATSAADGAPRARTVVLRDVSPGQRRVDFHTDRRSAKYAQLVNDPRVALHFLDRRAALQVRMLGRAAFLSSAKAAEIWRQLPEGARAKYEQAAQPGMDLAEAADEPLEPSLGEQNFTVVQVFVTDIDWLHLQSSGHCRTSFQFHDDRWVGRRIAP